MAWIESHQTVGHHPKTILFAELLKVNLPTAVGHLHYFWWWALDFAPSGEIRTTPGVLAKACEWRGNAERFRDALLTAGFVEWCNDALVIHDWMDYAGKLIDQRALRRESNRKAQSARRQRLVSADKADSQQSTVPDPTGPNQTVPPTPSAVSADADAQAPSGTASARRKNDDDGPLIIHANAGICPLCRKPYLGSYLEHTAESHKVRPKPDDLGAPGRIAGALPEEVRERLAAAPISEHAQ